MGNTNWKIICQSVDKVACVYLHVESKLSRENISVKNGRLRGSSIVGLQGKAKQDNSQARTKRSYNIPFKWKMPYYQLVLVKVLFTKAFVFGKEIINGHLPAVIVVIPLGSNVQASLQAMSLAVKKTLQDDVHVVKNVSYGVSKEKCTRTNMISVIRIYILYLHAVLIKQPGPGSQYMMQVSNMFTVNFIFCLSKANSWRHI